MKRIMTVFVLALLFAFPFRLEASGAIAAGFNAAIVGILTDTKIEQGIFFAKSLYDTYQTVQNTYNQLQNMIEAEKRALNNLRSIVDIKSFDDFMRWNNRQLYLARESEYLYDNLGVKIGNKTYRVKDIDEIPDALRNQFGDKYWNDFSEEQRMEMYTSLGLSPGNYMYLKTWQERNDAIAKNIRTYANIFAEEAEDAALRNQNIINKYSQENENLDANEIAKESHITGMNIEMAIREQNKLLIEMHEYTLSKDKMMETPPTPPRLSEHYNSDYFGSITGGSGKNDYQGF